MTQDSRLIQQYFSSKADAEQKEKDESINLIMLTPWSFAKDRLKIFILIAKDQ